MPESQLLSIDLTKEEDIIRLNQYQTLTKLYETKLPGQGVIHFRNGAGELPEHSFQHHNIEVSLQPRSNSLRKIGDLVKTENTQTGDIAIIPAKFRHWQKVETETSEEIIFNIEPTIISQIAHGAECHEQVELLPTFAKRDPLIYHIALNIKANFDSGDHDRLYAECLFGTLSMHLFRNYTARHSTLQEYQTGLSSLKLKQSIEYIQDNLAKPIKLSDIAQMLDLSQYYFCHLFKQSTGIAPYKYVIQQRVEQAKNLIRYSDLSLIDIAYECGFSSQSQMTQHFRKCVGVTPKVYRSNYE